MSMSITHRPRRLRRTSSIRALVRETHMQVDQLISPLFVKASLEAPYPIASMPGIFQWPLSHLRQEIQTLLARGVRSVILFGIPEYKDACGQSAMADDGIVQQAIACIKDIAPEMVVITDLCFCEYTNHGHCGVITDYQLDNDATLPLLAQQAISHANAGADIVAPSGMIDSMVEHIRHALDNAGYDQLPILSYAVKYASTFYSPFREAVEGTPQFGDRKGYQMDCANRSEAIREASLDIEQGADMIMVKPAMLYLDIILSLKQHFPEVPLAAYQVSGEYALLNSGQLDITAAMWESAIAIRRAGADMIITYFAKQLAELC